MRSTRQAVKVCEIVERERVRNMSAGVRRTAVRLTVRRTPRRNRCRVMGKSVGKMPRHLRVNTTAAALRETYQEACRLQGHTRPARALSGFGKTSRRRPLAIR